MRLVARIVTTVLIVSSAVLAGGFFWWTQIPPKLNGSFQTDVSAEVLISYDQRARPFVQASNWEDAFFTQGWLHARDRLWQMEMFRRAGKGRIAEVIGKSALATDIEIWRAGVPELATRMQAVASKRLLRYVEHYVAGINTWLGSDPLKSPEFTIAGFEPEPWTPADVFSLSALMAYQSANNKGNELVRLTLLEKLGAEKANIFFPSEQPLPDPISTAELSMSDLTATLEKLDLTATETHVKKNPLFSAPSLGSNSWAVSAQKAVGEKALFAFDSHDSVGLPNLTYDIHMFVGKEQIRGASVAGLLGVINGFNEFMAWGFTNIGDSQDLYIEKVDDNDPTRIHGRDGWYKATTQNTLIPVKGHPAHELTLITTKNGRMFSTSPPISIRWAPLEPHSFGLDALLKLNRATSYTAFNAAMDEFAAPSANVTYADITGRIAQRTIGLLPQRGRGAGLVPLAGDDPSTEWKGMLDMSKLPRHENPSTQYVLAANRPIHKGEPLISADNSPGYRVRRIEEYLAQPIAHDVASMRALQMDTVNLQAKRLLPKMLNMLDPDALTEHQIVVVSVLERWSRNPQDTRDSASAYLFAVWYQHFLEKIFSGVLGEDLFNQLLGRAYLVNEAVDNHLLNGNDRGWQVSEALHDSFVTAVSDVFPQDQDAVHWGSAHQLHLHHSLSGAFPGSEWLFDRGPLPAAGGNASVGRGRYSLKRPFNVSSAATARTVLRMSDPIEIYMISPGGQSGISSSRHYNDQTPSWLSGELDQIWQTPPQNTVHIRLLPN